MHPLEMQTADFVKCEALRVAIRQLLEKCTDEQRALFIALHPYGLGSLRESDLAGAFNLVARTVVKNVKAEVGTPEQQAHWAGNPETDGE